MSTKKQTDHQTTSDPAVASSDLLASLHVRFKMRASMAKEAKYVHVLHEDYAQANDCMIREQTWNAAAQMIEEEQAG